LNEVLILLKKLLRNMNQAYYQNLLIQQHIILRQQAQAQGNISSVQKVQDGTSSSAKVVTEPTTVPSSTLPTTSSSSSSSSTSSSTSTSSSGSSSSSSSSSSASSSSDQQVVDDKPTVPNASEHQHLSIQQPNVFHSANPTTSMPPPLPIHGHQHQHSYPYPPHLQPPMMYGYPPHFPPHSSIHPPIGHPPQLSSSSFRIPHGAPVSNAEANAFPSSASKHQATQKFQNRSSPPFRIGGRGSRQLAKALEEAKKQLVEPQNQQESQWVICMANPPCFAKAIIPLQESSSVLIQPLLPSPHDPALLTLWDGHIWLAKTDKLHSIQMKQEPGGWRIIETPKVLKFKEMLRAKGGIFSMPMTLNTAVAIQQQTGKVDWDMVSLESSDFDDASSADSILFPMLGKDLKSSVNRSRSPSPSALQTILSSSTTNDDKYSTSSVKNKDKPAASPTKGAKFDKSPNSKRMDKNVPSTTNNTEPEKDKKERNPLIALLNSVNNDKNDNNSQINSGGIASLQQAEKNNDIQHSDPFFDDSNNIDNNSLADFSEQMQVEFGDGFNSDMFDDFNTFSTANAEKHDTPKRVKKMSREPNVSDVRNNKSPFKANLNNITQGNSMTDSTSTKAPTTSGKSNSVNTPVVSSNKIKARKSITVADTVDEVDSDTTPKQLPKQSASLSQKKNSKGSSLQKVKGLEDGEDSGIDTDTTPKQLPKDSKAKEGKVGDIKCECGKTYSWIQNLYNHRKASCKLWKNFQTYLNSSLTCTLESAKLEKEKFTKKRLSIEEVDIQAESKRSSSISDKELRASGLESAKGEKLVEVDDKGIGSKKQASVGLKELKGLGLQELAKSNQIPITPKESLKKSADQQTSEIKKQRDPTEISTRELKNLGLAADVATTKRSESNQAVDKQELKKVATPNREEPRKRVHMEISDREIQHLGVVEVLDSKRRSSISLKSKELTIPTASLTSLKESNESLQSIPNENADSKVTNGGLKKKLDNDSTKQLPKNAKAKEGKTGDVECECGKTYSLVQNLYNHRKVTCDLWKGMQAYLNSSQTCTLESAKLEKEKDSKNKKSIEVIDVKAESKRSKVSISNETNALGLDDVAAQKTSGSKPTVTIKSSSSSSSKSNDKEPDSQVESKRIRPAISSKELRALGLDDVATQKTSGPKPTVTIKSSSSSSSKKDDDEEAEKPKRIRNSISSKELRALGLDDVATQKISESKPTVTIKSSSSSSSKKDDEEPDSQVEKKKRIRPAISSKELRALGLDDVATQKTSGPKPTVTIKSSSSSSTKTDDDEEAEKPKRIRNSISSKELRALGLDDVETGKDEKMIQQSIGSKKQANVGLKELKGLGLQDLAITKKRSKRDDEPDSQAESKRSRPAISSKELRALGLDDVATQKTSGPKPAVTIKSSSSSSTKQENPSSSSSSSSSIKAKGSTSSKQERKPGRYNISEKELKALGVEPSLVVKRTSAASNITPAVTNVISRVGPSLPSNTSESKKRKETDHVDDDRKKESKQSSVTSSKPVTSVKETKPTSSSLANLSKQQKVDNTSTVKKQRDNTEISMRELKNLFGNVPIEMERRIISNRQPEAIKAAPTSKSAVEVKVRSTNPNDISARELKNLGL